MELTVGAIVDGKVKTITKFGAFIALEDNKTGLVHISEVANTYVNDIHEHLTEGQDVKVMVIAIDPTGKINLSIKKALPKPAMPERRSFQNDRRSNPGERRAPQGDFRPQASRSQQSAPREPQSFEEKLKQFMSESDSKISSIRQYSDHKTKNRRR